MKHIIFDCDNTFGVPDCDVDDGLALIYLLGCPDAKLHGITATYGNNRVDVVFETIHRMLHDLGRTDITVKKGGAARGDYDSEASDYLVDMANRFPGELSILATGSLTNLMGAYQKDSGFFEKVKEIVLMGGITGPLVFDKKVMDELNFSCDPEASHTVLTKGQHVSVITGNNCLKVLFTKEEYKARLFTSSLPIAKYIREETNYWFRYNEDGYGIQGFYNWDVTAAVYLIHPELFEDHFCPLTLGIADMKSGFLGSDGEGDHCVCNLPVIREELPFKEEIYNTWLRVKM